MKDYLVDIAVKTNIWIRTELQREQFEVIRRARPSMLFLQSDGGRSEEEWEKIRKNRKMFDEEIDWDCKVIRIWENSNQGLYTMGRKTREIVWKNVDSCIFLEDDEIPAVSYFRFCAELLEKYKDDRRVYAICGTNCMEINERCSADYFFVRYASIWGVAMWKRSAMQYGTDFVQDQYTLDLLKDMTKKHRSYWKQIKEIKRSGRYDGHVPWDEFYMDLAGYGFHQLIIVPKYNMISNKGCDSNSTHADRLEKLPRAVRRLFNMSVYELEIPLKHPTYIIEDERFEFERNRILALDHPFMKIKRKIERCLLLLLYRDWEKIVLKIEQYFAEKMWLDF